MSNPRQVVVIGALASTAVIVGAHAYKREFPPGRQSIAAGLLFVGVAALADADPRLAAPASGLAFASIALAQGLDFAKGLDNVKSYKGATVPVPGAQGTPGSAGSLASPPGGFTPSNPLSPATDTGKIGSHLSASALSWLGTPYRFAGTSRSGIDCSGLTQAVCASVGIKIPHNTVLQYHSTGRIYKDTNPPAGAIVFFNWPTEVPPGHCGISLGNGSFVHAPHTGDVVKVSNLADYLKQGATWYGYTLPFQKG